MTIIVIDTHTRQVAADKQFTVGNSSVTGTKLFKLYSKAKKNKKSQMFIVGIFGECTRALELKDWFQKKIDGVKDNPFPESNNSLDMFGKYKCGSEAGIVVVDSENNKVYSYYDSEYPIEYEDTFLAFGSGQDFAVGYHHAHPLGDVAEVVGTVSHLDIYCGKGVTIFDY